MLNLRTLLLLLLPAVSLQHQCKDDPSYSCSDSQTCCPLPRGQGYGCCPYREAVCCSDKQHCCPHGLQCDTKAGRCLGADYALLLERLLVKPEQKQVEVKERRPSAPLPWTAILGDRKTCPDKSYSCEKTQTCCQLQKGWGWGCCPLGPKAVCCPDHAHCCPEGSTCDVEDGSCIGRPWFIQYLTLIFTIYYLPLVCPLFTHSMSTIYPKYVHYLPKVFLLFTPYLPTIFSPDISPIFPWYAHYLPLICPLFIPDLSAICPWYVHHLPHMSTMHSKYVHYLPKVFLLFTLDLPTFFPPDISPIFPWNAHYLPLICPLFIPDLSTIYPSYVHHLPLICPLCIPSMSTIYT